jgi:hypothetical protein
MWVHFPAWTEIFLYNIQLQIWSLPTLLCTRWQRGYFHNWSIKLDHSMLSTGEVKNTCSCTFHPSIHVYSAVTYFIHLFGLKGDKGDTFTTEALSLTTLCCLLVRLRIYAAVSSTPPYMYIVQWHTLYIYLVSYFFFKVDDDKWLYSGYSWYWKARYI